MCNLDEMSTEDEFKQYCFELEGVDYDDLPGTAKAQKVRELITFLEKRDRIADVLKLGRQKRPELQWDAPVAELTIEPVAAPVDAPTAPTAAPVAVPTLAPTAEAAATHLGDAPDVIGTGLQALAKAMLDPEVQMSVARFRCDFEFAQSRIARLDALNKQQSLLQDIEAQQRQIELGITLATASEQTWAQAKPLIAGVISTGAQIINAREQIMLAGSMPLWVERLASSGEDMQTALATLDVETLEVALDRLSRVIDLGSAFISGRLLATIDDLLRSGLAARMLDLRDQLLDLKVEDAIVAEFNALLEALDKLTISLRTLSADYQGWHGLLSELRFMSEVLGSDDRHLDRTWADISATSRTLISGSTEDWALDMIRIDGNVQAAFEEKAIDKARDSLAGFLELARKQRLAVVGN